MFFKLIKLKKGEIVSISIAEITDCIINLSDCKKKLPYDKYVDVFSVYSVLKKQTNYFYSDLLVFNKITLLLGAMVEDLTGVRLTIDGKVHDYVEVQGENQSIFDALTIIEAAIKSDIEAIATEVHERQAENLSAREAFWNDEEDLHEDSTHKAIGNNKAFMVIIFVLFAVGLVCFTIFFSLF